MTNTTQPPDNLDGQPLATLTCAPTLPLDQFIDQQMDIIKNMIPEKERVTIKPNLYSEEQITQALKNIKSWFYDWPRY